MKLAFSLLYIAAVLAAPALAQTQAVCGKEGQKPCEDGCSTKFMPDGAVPSEWYPDSDNYVLAPPKYRQTEGLCTRCGNLYEPACIRKDGSLVCFIDPHAGRYMEVAEDGYCVPPEQSVGCGTTGEPPCPADLVDKYGTLAVLTRMGSGWEISASLGLGEDNCLLSKHNLMLRFVKAPEWWLPPGHKCANVCVQCGMPGRPACPPDVGPQCIRRRSLENPEFFRDGPTFINDGLCTALHCGSATDAEGPLPPCEPDTAPVRLPESYDTNNDGCAEPYVRTTNGCELPAQPPANAGVPQLNAQEYGCAREGFTLIDENLLGHVADLVKLGSVAQERYNVMKANKGKCMACGAGDDEIPCRGYDFGGCLLQKGYILDPNTKVCVKSPCGGNSNFLTSSPWGAAACPEQPFKYTDDNNNPVNENNQCNYFHNLEDGVRGEKSCERCGWPGHMCNKECIYGIEYVPKSYPEVPAGTFAVRPEFRTGGGLANHCQPLPRLHLYPDQCPKPTRSNDINDDIESLPPAQVYPSKASQSNDNTFGTKDNPDSCKHPLQYVKTVYSDVCPGGGTPVSRYGQCGGRDYKGPTCCFGYSVCVKNSEFYSGCEPANVPTGTVPWHQQCIIDEKPSPCEPGSTCTQVEEGNSVCHPDSNMIHKSSHKSSRKRKGAAVGIAIGVLTLIVLAIIIGFVVGRRRGIKKSQYKLGSWGDAESYATNSNALAGKGRPATPGNTYLDLAAASEAEALHNKKSTHSDGHDPMSSPNHVHLPTSDFGIGRRA